MYRFQSTRNSAACTSALRGNLLIVQGLRSAGGLRRPLRSRKARKNATKNTCKGGGKKRPMIWCGQRFDNAKSCLCRANCPVVLSCAVYFCYRCHVLVGTTGVICVGRKQGAVKDQIHVEKEKKRKVVPNNTYIIPGTALCSKESTQRSTTQHRSEGHGTAPHGSARCYAALLGYIYI